MNKNNIENITEVFKCFICWGKLKSAHLCPHCSKLCCFSCIRQWLVTSRQSRCPHCQVTLRLRDLVNCRWVENINQQLDTLHEVEENAKKELCATHNENLSVFCLNCEECICAQCALWDAMHSGHAFKPLEEVCLEHKESIKEDLIHLRKRHSEIKGFIMEIEKTIEELTYARNERVTEIKHSASQMISNLEKKLQPKLSNLRSTKNMWSLKSDNIETILNSSEKELLSCSVSELLAIRKKISQCVSGIKHISLVNPQNLNAVDLQFPSEVIPPYENCTFIIPNFSCYQSKVIPIYSEPLCTLGLTWRLKVFPTGNSIGNSEYLSVLLELSSGFKGTSKYQFKVEMIHQESGDPSKNLVQEFTSEFEVCESWGFNRFYRLDKLACDGYLNADELVLKFGVRSASYYEKCRVQNWFINQLQEEIIALSK